MQIHFLQKTYILLFVFFLFACSHSSAEDAGNYQTNESEAEENQGMLELKGTIRYLDFEGGFYGFIAEDGAKYTLGNLPKEHRRDGLIVKLQVVPVPDIMTTTQYGEYVRIKEIRIIDESQVNARPKKSEY